METKNTPGPNAIRGPWYFTLDELMHRGLDPFFPWKWYWQLRCGLCRYVDRRLGVSDAEMDRT